MMRKEVLPPAPNGRKEVLPPAPNVRKEVLPLAPNMRMEVLPPAASLRHRRHSEGGNSWTAEQHKVFQRALAQIYRNEPDRWEKIMAMLQRIAETYLLNRNNDLQSGAGLAGLMPFRHCSSSPHSSRLTLDSDGCDGRIRRGCILKRARDDNLERKKSVLRTEDEHEFAVVPGLKMTYELDPISHAYRRVYQVNVDCSTQLDQGNGNPITSLEKMKCPQQLSIFFHSACNPRKNNDLEALHRLHSKHQVQVDSLDGPNEDAVMVNNDYLRLEPQQIPGDKSFYSSTFDLLTSVTLPCTRHCSWKNDDPGLGWGIVEGRTYKAVKRTFVFHKNLTDKEIKTNWVMNVYILLDSNNKVQSGFYLCHVFQSDDYDPRPTCIPSLPPMDVDPENIYPIGTSSSSNRKRRRSDVWKKFTEIEAHGPGRNKLILAICNHCCMVYGPGSTNGTTTLKNHIKVCNHKGRKNCRFGIAQMNCPIDESSKGIGLLSNIEQYEDLPQDYDCTNEDLRAIEYLKSASETEKLVDIDGAFAHQTHMKCLIEPNTYLLGIVINAYINCLRSQQHLNNRDDGRVFLEDTFISTMLKENGQHVPEEEDGGDEFLVHRVEKYLEYDMVFLPINIKNEHWYLAVVNAAKHSIQVLDSLCWTSRRDELYQTLKGIEHNFNVLIKRNRKWRYLNHKWKDLKVTTWEVHEHLPIAIQQDGVSCGLFMLKFMEHWMGDKLSQDITQDNMSKFRIKLAAVLIRWKSNMAKSTTHAEDVTDTRNISDCEPIDSKVDKKAFADSVRRKYQSVLHVISLMDKQELVNGICNYIRSIDDANTLEKEWVQNSKPYPISLSLRKIKDILNVDKFMEADCFNMGVRIMALDEHNMLKGRNEPNETYVSRQYMDLQFRTVSAFAHGNQYRVQPHAQQFATSLDSSPEIDPDVQLCKMIFVPALNFGMFTIYVIDQGAKTVTILDPNHIQPGPDKKEQMQRYISCIKYIALIYRLAKKENCPGYDEDISLWPHMIPNDVPTNQGVLSGYLALLFMRAWNGNGERLQQIVCNDGYELRKQFLIGLLMYEENECEKNVHDGVREILRCIKNNEVK